MATDYLAKGGDVSWLPQMEATGFKFFESDGTETDCLEILKNRGMNTVRLRVFVNPSNSPQNGHCSKEETVEMALRAKNLGMKVMIDFHYSDTWADPANQTKPAAWANSATHPKTANAVRKRNVHSTASMLLSEGQNRTMPRKELPAKSVKHNGNRLQV